MKAYIHTYIIIPVLSVLMLNGCGIFFLAKDFANFSSFEGPDMSVEHLLDRSEFATGIAAEKLTINPDTISRDAKGLKTRGEIFWRVKGKGKNYRCEMSFDYDSSVDKYTEAEPVCRALQ